jgi:CubicO group peptidase (beta-lactamase class C family)
VQPAFRAFAALAHSLAVLPGFAQTIDGAAVAAYFDAAMAIERIEHPVAGAVVAVVHDGELLFAKGYGYADVERRILADPERTLFRIASVTKTFVWTAVMQLVEAGKLDIDADVNTYLDFGIPATFEQPITVRHLMTHTAGFEDAWVGVSARRAEALAPLGEYLAKHVPRRVRPPGKLPSYSNYGTALAGYIVQRVSGLAFEEYVELRILQPLGMQSTSARQPLPPPLAQRLAVGYGYQGGRFVARPYYFDRIAPDGVMSSTASDMARFMSAHLKFGAAAGAGDARILAEGTARRMQSVLFQVDTDINPYLHGLYRSDRNGVEIFGHAGDWNGFHSVMALLPQHGLGVFVSFNAESGAEARANLVLGFIDRFFPRELPEDLKGVALAGLGDYAGEWAFARRNHSGFEKLGVLANVVNVVPTDDGQLLLDVGGKPSRWIALRPDRFRELYGARRLVFLRDSAGHVVNAAFSSNPSVALEKLEGLHAPALHMRVLVALGGIALLGVLGYGMHALRPAPAPVRLPRGHAALGWLLGAGMLVLLIGLVVTLAGETSEFEFGAPAGVIALQWIAATTAALAVVVTWFAARNVVRRAGGTGARLRYAILALAGLVFTLELWYWNMLGIPRIAT